MTTDTLLPPNATPQERALEQAMRPGADALAGIGLIRTAKENPPDDWLYWLVWEYGLEELLPYLPNPRDALERGIEWQRLRGTPQSLHIAFEWVALGDTVIEPEKATSVHWYEYQLAPGKVPSPTDLKNLVGLARLSAPIGTRLSRVYHEYDLRHGEYDYTRWSDGSLYCSDSGVYDPDLGIIVSFGRRHVASITWQDIQFFGHVDRLQSMRGDMGDRLIYSQSYYDDLPFPVYAFNRVVSRVTIMPGAGRNLRVLDGTEALGMGLLANGGNRPEQPQYPARHTSESMALFSYGWTPSAGWETRTWNEGNSE